MADYVRVVGRFFTHQKTDGAPVPLQGRVFFTPVTSAYGEGTVYGAVERTGYVIDGVLCEDKAGATPGLSLLAPGEGVQPSAWSYRVVFSLTDEDGDRACLESFYLEAKAGDEIDLATVSPVPDPVTGEYMLRGDRGEKGDPGRNGVSYTGIDLVGEELVFHRTDGEDQRVPAPRGKDGEPGRDGVDGAPGKDGVSPPAPNISVGEVSEGEAAATVTGSYPDLKLNLAIPRGAAGPKGADAEPLNLAVTASTLAAGSEATASLSGDYPNLTLALGLPAGAKGDTGVGLPGPKGERGDVTVTQQGMVFGEGFPEGKVTATPGTVYTDTAVTNGAMQWIKKSGTGATGWAVTVGDTGWRLFHAQNPDGADSSTVSKYTSGWVRRIGSEVHFVAYIGKNTASPWSNVSGLPEGFRALSGSFRVANTSGNEFFSNVSQIDSKNYIIWNINGDRADINDTIGIFHGSNEVRSKGLSRSGWVSLRWPTDNAWPSMLPGTPA